SLQFGLKHLARKKSVDDADNRYNFTGGAGSATLGNPALARTIADFSWGEAFPIAHYPDLPVANPAGLEQLFDQRPDLFTFDAASSRANSVEDDYRIHETIWAGYLMGTLDVTSALRLTLGARVEHTDVRASANTFVATMTASGFPAG